jgi:4-amino-4-deoxy-L-arabinose transferase-like glycosyltransferase
MDERFSVLLFRTCLVGCLLGVAATLYFLFGLAGHIHSAVLNFSVVIVLLGAALFLLFHFFAIPRQTNWVGRTLWAAIFAILILEIVLGLLPPTSRDELTHHLAIPRLYAQAGQIIEVPMATYSYYPMLIDMLYTPWVYWGYDFVPKWIHALFGFLTGLLLYAYCGGRINAIYGLVAFFFFISMPVIARLSHWGYIDLGITFYTTASLIGLLLWRENRDALQWLNLAALSLGFALATKPNGLVAALLISLLFLLIIVKPPRREARQVTSELLLYGGLMVLPFLPWLVKNWAQTGNPFFPLLSHFFSPRGPTSFEGASFGGIAIFVKRELLYGENMWQIIALPLRVFFSGRDDNPQFFDGVLTPILIVLVPWTFKGKWLEEKKLLAGFALLFLTYAIFLVDLRIRYILSIVPPLVILAVYGIFNLYLRIKQPVYLFAGLIVFAAWHGAFLWRYVSAAEPFGYLSGNESREAYLGRMVPEYAAFQYINRATALTAKIYLLFVGRRSYYCERDYFHDGGDLPGYLLGVIRASKSAEQIDQALKGQRITHLMAREDLLVDFLTHNLTPAQAATWSQFAQRYLVRNFRDRGYAVYQLHG